MKNIKNVNVFEIIVDPENFNDKLKELQKPGLTEEYLKECKQIANLYKKDKDVI